jgi:hypothetical protein
VRRNEAELVLTPAPSEWRERVIRCWPFRNCFVAVLKGLYPYAKFQNWPDFSDDGHSLL